MTTQLLLGCAYSCLSCCIKEIHQACANLVGVEAITKFYYLMLNLLVVVPSLAMFYYIDDWTWFVRTFARWIECPEQSGGKFNCYGVASVYRLSFSLMSLYVLLVLVMLCRNRLARVLNEMLFFVKYVLVIAGFVALLYIPNEVIVGYARASQYMGVVFLLLQSIILIDLFYLWGIKLVRRYDEGSKWAAAIVITLTALAEASAVALNVYGYLLFQDCSLHINIVTSVLLVILPCVQLLHFNPQNSLLATALVSLYVSYLSLIGQYSSEECHMLDFEITCIDIVASVCLFFITMGGSIVGTKIKPQPDQATATLNEDFVDDSVEMDSMEKPPAPKRQVVVEEDQPMQPAQTDYRGCLWIKWHTYMAIGSIYIAMMATNWSTPDPNDHLMEMYPPSEFGSWARIGLSWASCLIYIWTLIAPRLCPHRNFTIE